MAQRPVFIPGDPDRSLVVETGVDFIWSPGFAVSQKQKSVASLHEAAEAAIGPGPYLEISSKSPEHLGTQLSAFHLLVEGFADHPVPVENAFQGSKVFESGGPYTDLYGVSPLEAKRDPRIRTTEPVTAFRVRNEQWPNLPRTAFYDWVYLKALIDRADLLNRLQTYAGFTDIEFNPGKSLNCQARSCALAVALVRHGLLADAMDDQDSFIEICFDNTSPQQSNLFY